MFGQRRTREVPSRCRSVGRSQHGPAASSGSLDRSAGGRLRRCACRLGRSLAVLLFVAFWLQGAIAVSEPPGPNPFPNRTLAPSLDGGTAWLNTSRPLTLKELRGKVVLLDFWTYCCINCLHVLPDLKFLEEKYANELVVIGVHSAKFDNEKLTENIRQAILRLGIRHPVVNDSRMVLWRKFDVHAWPTLVLIDPEGYYCGFVSGEGHRDTLDRAIRELIQYHRAKGTLNDQPLRWDLERLAPTPLRFPGKVLADGERGRLFVADTGHNRIVVCSLDGRLLDVVGSGQLGRRDGPFELASFDHPQGLALVGERLFVADTENHLIRVVDLKRRTVETLAGTGRQARGRPRGGPLRSTPLNSPWDLCAVGDVLYVAMAGSHQLWQHRLGADTLEVFAGTGREDVQDGPLSRSAFAQPSGLTTDGTDLFVADSEGSAVRRVRLGRGQVETLAGPSNLPNGRALFRFGDRDGVGASARFQHPLAVAWWKDQVLVADTYNHKIRSVDPDTGRVTTVFDGAAEDGKSPGALAEPGGLSCVGDRLFVADTNHHRLCVLDLKTGRLSELQVDGLKPPSGERSGR